MIIKPSATLRNEYSTISDLAKKTGEPIYITKNGEGDMVLMSLEAFERREELLKLRQKVLAAEQNRLNGSKAYTLHEAEEILNGRIEKL